jgi:hypothetical protein
MQAKGTFEIQMTGEPPYSTEDGVTLARAVFTKQFTGDLVGDSRVDFLGARTPVDGSAGYVGLERIAGTLGGRAGSFCAIHHGLMDRGAKHLTISIVPDSGTGELTGIRGTIDIEIVAKQHHYAIDYTIEP